MRSDPREDQTAPAFTLTCPGYHGSRKHAGGSSTPGTLKFSIGDDVLAEIEHKDLLESWQVASELSVSDSVKMSAMAGGRLAEILESGLESADLTEAVADAAVVFLLAMKRQGIADPKRIPPCTVMWHGQDARESVLLGA